MRKYIPIIALALSASAHALTLSAGSSFLNGSDTGNAWQITDTLNLKTSGSIRYGVNLGLADFGAQAIQHNSGHLPGYRPSPIAAYLPPSRNANLASIETRAVFAMARISGRQGQLSAFAGMGPALYRQRVTFTDATEATHTGLGLMANVGIAYHFGGWHVQASYERIFAHRSDNAVMVGLGVTL